MFNVILTLFLKNWGKRSYTACLRKRNAQSSHLHFYAKLHVCRAVDFSRAGSQLVRHMCCGKTKDVWIYCIKKNVVQFNTWLRVDLKKKSQKIIYIYIKKICKGLYLILFHCYMCNCVLYVHKTCTSWNGKAKIIILQARGRPSW